MSYSRRGNGKRPKTQKKRKNKIDSTIYVGLVGFLLIAGYLLGYVYKFLNKESIAVETVQPGTIEVSKDYRGVIIRDEYIIKSTVDGAITSYYTEGEKVKKNSIVCSIKDSNQVQSLEEQILQKDNEISKIQNNRSDISLIQDDIDKINVKIENIAANYITGGLENKINNLYSFRNRLDSEITLRNQILISDSQGSAKAITEERAKLDEQLRNSINDLLAPESGIISFSIDGFEDVYTIDKVQALKPEQTEMEIEQYTINSNNIKADEPVFRIIDDFKWYIASYIPDDDTNGWAIGDSKILTTFKDEKNISLEVKIQDIIQGDNKRLIVFCTDRNMMDFINSRSILFQVEKKAYEGLKVPNTAIVEKSVVKIPASAVADNTVIKVQESSNMPISVRITHSDETGEYVYILQDFINIKIGDSILQNHGGEQKYIIPEDSAASLPGVYIVNSGNAELKIVKIIQQDNTHSIVEAVGTNPLLAYDRIISDVKSVQDGDLIDGLD